MIECDRCGEPFELDEQRFQFQEIDLYDYPIKSSMGTFCGECSKHIRRVTSPKWKAVEI